VDQLPDETLLSGLGRGDDEVTVAFVRRFQRQIYGVALSFDTDLGDRRVTCELIERDGAVSTLGTYVLADGYGYWGAPIGVSPSAVSSVRLVDATGTTVAWARFGSAV
jgi:hypothetical protein